MRPLRPVGVFPWLVALVMALLPGGASAASPDGLTDAEAAQFVLTLQEAVRAGAPRAVAALIAFPLRVNGAKGPSRIPNADVFVRRYRTIFTDSVRTAVLAQVPAQVFRNWRGGMIGNGELWFAGICDVGPPRLRLSPLRCPQRRRNWHLGTARRCSCAAARRLRALPGGRHRRQ